MTATALSRARRIPVCVPASPGSATGPVRLDEATVWAQMFGDDLYVLADLSGRETAPPADDLLDPAYPDTAAWADYYTLQAARRRARRAGSRGSHAVAVCVSVGERLFADRERLLRLVISERVGRPAATVSSVLDELTRRMAEFAQTEDYEDTDPVQALRMVAGGMLAELDAVNDPDVIGARPVTSGEDLRG